MKHKNFILFAFAFSYLASFFTIQAAVLPEGISQEEAKKTVARIIAYKNSQEFAELIKALKTTIEDEKKDPETIKVYFAIPKSAGFAFKMAYKLYIAEQTHVQNNPEVDFNEQEALLTIFEENQDACDREAVRLQKIKAKNQKLLDEAQNPYVELTTEELEEKLEQFEENLGEKIKEKLKNHEITKKQLKKILSRVMSRKRIQEQENRRNLHLEKAREKKAQDELEKQKEQDELDKDANELKEKLTQQSADREAVEKAELLVKYPEDNEKRQKRLAQIEKRYKTALENSLKLVTKKKLPLGFSSSRKMSILNNATTEKTDELTAEYQKKTEKEQEELVDSLTFDEYMALLLNIKKQEFDKEDKETRGSWNASNELLELIDEHKEIFEKEDKLIIDTAEGKAALKRYKEEKKNLIKPHHHKIESNAEKQLRHKKAILQIYKAPTTAEQFELFLQLPEAEQKAIRATLTKDEKAVLKLLIQEQAAKEQKVPFSVEQKAKKLAHNIVATEKKNIQKQHQAATKDAKAWKLKTYRKKPDNGEDLKEGDIISNQNDDDNEWIDDEGKDTAPEKQDRVRQNFVIETFKHPFENRRKSIAFLGIPTIMAMSIYAYQEYKKESIESGCTPMSFVQYNLKLLKNPSKNPLFTGMLYGTVGLELLFGIKDAING